MENSEKDYTNIETTDLNDPENAIAKLSIFALLHLQKSGIIYLGSQAKLVKDIFKYKKITIKQKEVIASIACFHIVRLGGLEEFNSTLKKLSN